MKREDRRHSPFPFRVAGASCVLDGKRFLMKVCKRCGYRRNAAKEMPRYAMCGEAIPKVIKENKRQDLSALNALSTVANETGTG